MKPVTPESVIQSHKIEMTDEMIGFFNDQITDNFKPHIKTALINEDSLVSAFRDRFEADGIDMEYFIQLIPRILKETYGAAGWNVMCQKLSTSGNRYLFSIREEFEK